MSYARALATVLVDELARAGVVRTAVVLRVRTTERFEIATALVDDKPRVFDGEVVPPGIASATLTADESTWRALFAKSPSPIEAGAVVVTGDPAAVASLKSALSAGKSPLQVRLER